MKKITTSFILLFLMAASNSFSQGFTSVFSKDGMNVIAVGGNRIFRSSDGGATWGSMTVNGSMFYSVWAVGSNIWITDQSTNGVYTSTNDGATWTNYMVMGTSAVYGICYTDAMTGYVAGTNGIYKTVNGGVSWMAGPSVTRDTYVSVRFTNSMNGVACSMLGRIIYTTNGGMNWIQGVNPAIGKELHSIDIKGNLAIATGADAFILRSTDAGMSWSITDFRILTHSDVWGVSIVDMNKFFTCGGGGFIRMSGNGGASFDFNVNPMMADLTSIYMFDALNGWAVSSKTTAVIRTTTGGNSWVLPTGTTVGFNWAQTMSTSGNIGNGLYFHPQNKKGLFAGIGAAVYRSPDLGETWTQISTMGFGGGAHSFYVNPRDTNLFIAAVGTAGGRVIKSADYGVTWTSVWGPGSLTSYGMPLEMDPNHPDTLYLAPNGSVLLRSTDFGDTWSNWGNFTFSNPCDMLVMFDSSNTIYFGDQGAGGLFYRSSDYGVNWNLLFSPGGAEVPMIGVSNLDPKRLFFTNWAGQGFWRSTNNGANWSVVGSTGGAWGADISKDDPNVVAYGTYGGPVSISTDGGNTFNITQPNNGTNYGLYFFDRGTLIAEQGNGIYKLRVTYDFPLAVNQISGQVPKKYYLSQNYPNPFNPATTIRYDVPKQANVKIDVFDILGRLVQTPVNQVLNPGQYEFSFNASNLASGIYYYKIESAGFSDVKKMVLVK